MVGCHFGIVLWFFIKADSVSYCPRNSLCRKCKDALEPVNLTNVEMYWSQIHSSRPLYCVDVSRLCHHDTSGRKIRALCPETCGVSDCKTSYHKFEGFNVGRTLGYESYDSYVETQKITSNSKFSPSFSWVFKEDIELLGDWILYNVKLQHKFGICHGTRSGNEQKWFMEVIPGVSVIGTDLGDAAASVEHTVQMDFHETVQSWLGKVDFIYSNSLDHSYDPVFALRQWMRTLSPTGVLLLEHCEQGHSLGDSIFSRGSMAGKSLRQSSIEMRQYEADIYGASFGEYLRLISQLGFEILHVIKSPKRWHMYQCRFIIGTHGGRERRLFYKPVRAKAKDMWGEPKLQITQGKSIANDVERSKPIQSEAQAQDDFRASQEDIHLLARWAKYNLHLNHSFGISLGSGKEQAWFMEMMPGVTVIDGHIVPFSEDWVGHTDFIYSQVLDHAEAWFEAAQCVTRWMALLSATGVLFLNHCEAAQHVRYIASFGEYLKLVAGLGFEILQVLQNPWGWYVSQCRIIIATHGGRSRRLFWHAYQPTYFEHHEPHLHHKRQRLHS
eukprot:gnl/MRDRNA2_/MRDRNA2_142433_c0_seq1.p1 gnl/MRDRNA2_/MRDRNA2_142433_c0~~gnl/MRDRNA2_/MRDRNA2_142433_c0_seq1.p1  ORF type:complete len:555 (-),score=53.43 gnl/MRDRNA2_/MRDRNA2_142433_c0_seq1:77-1741(-)